MSEKTKPPSPSDIPKEGFSGFSATEHKEFVKAGKNPNQRKDLEDREKEKKDKEGKSG